MRRVEFNTFLLCSSFFFVCLFISPWCFMPTYRWENRSVEKYLLPLSGKSKIWIQTCLPIPKFMLFVRYHLLHSPRGFSLWPPQEIQIWRFYQRPKWTTAAMFSKPMLRIGLWEEGIRGLPNLSSSSFMFLVLVRFEARCSFCCYLSIYQLWISDRGCRMRENKGKRTVWNLAMCKALR